MSEEKPGFVFPCKHIRSKEMYYDAPAGGDDEFSSGMYWCARTNETFGPDGQPVERQECKAGRSCFED